MRQPIAEALARGRPSAIEVASSGHLAAPRGPLRDTLSSHIEAMESWDNEGGAPRADIASAPLRVLVVEDDAIIALLYHEVLEGMGYEVCATVGDEAAAVAAALRCNPDLMLVDQRLGSGSGVRAVEAILATLYIPQVFVSGDPQAVRLVRPDAVVLRKPFHEAELGAAIEQALAADALPPGKAGSKSPYHA